MNIHVFSIQQVLPLWPGRVSEFSPSGWETVSEFSPSGWEMVSEFSPSSWEMISEFSPLAGRWSASSPPLAGEGQASGSDITPWSPGLCCFSAVALGASPHGWDSGPSGRDPWGNLGVGFCSSFSAFLLPGLLFCRSQPPGSPSALSPAPSSCQDPGAGVAPTPTWKEAARWPGHPRPPDRGPRSRAATVQCLRTVA